MTQKITTIEERNILFLSQIRHSYLVLEVHLDSEVLINWMSCGCLDGIKISGFDLCDWVIMAVEQFQEFLTRQFHW